MGDGKATEPVLIAGETPAGPDRATNPSTACGGPPPHAPHREDRLALTDPPYPKGGEGDREAVEG